MAGWSPFLDKIYDPLIAGSIDGTDEEPHDHGIVRALQAKYKPNKLVVGNPSLTLFVSRISPQTKEETLYETFSHFGKIRQCRLVRDLVTGFSKCYGFVEFESERAMRQALSQGKKITIDDKEILVDMEHERTLKNWVPRRLGGGFGGKKESGQLRFGGLDRPFRKPIFVNQKSDTNRSDSSEKNLHYRDRTEACSEYDNKKSRRRLDEYSGSSRSRQSKSNFDDRQQRYRTRSPRYKQ